jgi:hypothetical protein
MSDGEQRFYSTVWSYMTTDDSGRRYRRTVFFYAGSIEYDGRWLGPTDCVWMVPAPLDG